MTTLQLRLDALTELAFLQGEATRIKDAIGVVNNSIQRLEGLYEQNTARNTGDKVKRNLLGLGGLATIFHTAILAERTRHLKY